MLRRRFVFNLAPLVALLLIMAIVAILQLQGVLRDLRQIQAEDWVAVDAVTNRLRWMVLALSLVFVVVINISVVVLLRMGAMILRPVEALLKGTEELARERFDHRIDLHRTDEFALLAKAYNDLASKLQASEQRKVEMLHQAAVMLNHELNNAGSIIQLQLQLLSRQSGNRPALEKCLREIHEGLDRMTTTVQSLKNVRRIVLTDYAPGTKMLDLQRSLTDEGPIDAPQEPTAAPGSATTTSRPTLMQANHS
jgi:signal transduction histidine kinase